MRRGQSTVELALIAPFIVGILALVLQGGVLVADQVALEQYAYAGAQWATSQGGAAAPDQIQNYVANIMCTGVGSATPTPSVPSTSASSSRYCTQEPAGVPQPTLSTTPSLVSVTWSPVSLRSPWNDLPAPVTEALADAPACQTWGLNASLSQSSVVAGGANGTGSTTVSISFTGNSPSGNPADASPVVTLSGGPWPPGLSPQTPVPSPQQVAPGGAGGLSSTSSAVLNTTTSTPPGTYHFSVTGLDQCGDGPRSGNTALDLTVTGVQASPTASTAPTINGIQPPDVCGATGSVINILGTNFGAGMTVDIGTLPLSGETVVNPTDISGTTPPGLAPGVYNVTILSSTGTPLANAASAITALASCSVAPSPSPSAATCGLAVKAAPGAPYEAIITVTWYEPLVIPLLAISNSPYFTLTARQVVLCQSGPRPSPFP